MSSSNKKDSNQKKRKMWRTVNVSAGGGPPQSMTPEAAAKYIQQAASQSSSGRNGNGGREVKISFGPSRPPSRNSGSSGSINLGNLDLQALKETAAAAAMAGKPKGSKNNKDGLPCTEAEMKALMSMFVEIMGMSMDSEKMRKAASGNNKKGPVFMFGNSNGIPMPPGGWSDASAETMAAATAGFFADGASWEAIRRTYGGMMNDDDEEDDDDDDEDDDDGSEEEYDDDSLPNLDDMRQLFQAHQKSHFEAMARSRMNSGNSFNREIPASDWESLEQVAMDDALEAEERARKAAKKREKKQRKKQKQKEEAAQKAAEAAMKKKEKAILSWRSRVVSTCQSGEVSKLNALLDESPLRKAPDEESLSRSYVLPHLEFLLPNSVAKNRSVLNRGQDARIKLAEFILCQDTPIVFTPLRSGRTALHSACCHGDLQFLKYVLNQIRDYEDTEHRIPSNYLDQTCTESGWSLLHYASVTGSKEILEVLLQEGCNVATITDDTHTWRKSDGKGVTARELAQYIHRNEHEKVLETHGLALQDIINTFCSNHSERRTYQSNIHRVLTRLTDIENNGYSPPKHNAASQNENENSSDAQQQQQESASSRKRKKKKKKKQAQKAAEEAKQEAAKAAAAAQEQEQNTNTEEKDPLVVALMGMGFSEQQIDAAVKACGGTNRATADDLVTWILGQDADGNGNGNSGAAVVHETEITESTVNAIAYEQVQKAEAAAREKEEAAKRLAAKREEQRRRNRAWNDSQQSKLSEASKAKTTKAMMPQRQAAAPPPPAAYAAAYPTLQSTISSGSGGRVSPSVATKPAPKPPAVPKPAVIPKKILSKPVASVPKKVPASSVKPAPTAKATKTEKPVVVPKILKKPEAEKPAAKAMPKPAPRAVPPTKPPPKVDSPPEIRNIVKENPVEAKPAPVLAQSKILPASNGAFSMPSALPVSSVPLVPPPQSSAPPPGFMAPSPPSNMVQQGMPPPGVSFAPLDSTSMLNPSNGMGLPVDQGQLGEIRATAKAFVPTSFGSSVPAGDPGMPPLSGTFANPQASSGMPPLGGAPEGKSIIQSAFAPGILAGGLGGPPGLLDGDNHSGQDRMPSMTPISTDSTTNTTTSLSGFEESGLAGIPLGFGMDLAQQTGGTSSLLDSFAAAPPAPVPASSIWGGPQGGGAALDAFSSLGLGSVGGESSNQFNDKNSHANGNLWGGAASSNPPAGNQGSIW